VLESEVTRGIRARTRALAHFSMHRTASRLGFVERVLEVHTQWEKLADAYWREGIAGFPSGYRYERSAPARHLKGSPHGLPSFFA